ncbi:uncharacterized protein N7446_003205 [Penicillium canescens]|uniref:Rhodopsin domain-containing protein n=1 Tax=Penicillium canescens TaxID=5083 RepID=A0AAD6IFJ8_PENCN|nr:uncharacterized protein N7446_003205 [Penicillium canescens]KAJ6045004.1 hypothetical protein N7460_006359 [Penicillium canescens]KAJ6056474.1 hypothetical protein N7444_005572 [Penicillium canescens]KAJ6075428.1 hypothetical protein N7446_003205 [Penicillium canescens]
MSSAQQSSGATWTPGDFEHPNEDIRRPIKIALVFAFTLSTLAVVLRLVARRMTGSRLFLDDYLILVALFFKYACSSGVVTLLYNGLGSHITMIPPKNLVFYFQIGYSNNFVYTSCVAFVKFSILALYKRLFAIRYMVVGVHIMTVVVLLWVVGVFVSGALLCIPANKFWDQSIPGACLNPYKFYYGIQIPNILCDLIILLMPAKVVWSLPVPKSQKVLLSGIFLVGGLTFVFDIARLYAMIKLLDAGPDITYHQVPVVVWTCIEATVGIIAACLPNLRPLFKLGKSGFWSQLRSTGRTSERTLVSNKSGTMNSNETMSSIQKPNTVTSYVAEESIEIAGYNNFGKAGKV